MRLKQLHYFMAIAEYLNYKYAAEAVDVSPSLLSQQIVSLEEELNVPLFERNKKSIRLTAAGEELKKRIPEIEDLMAETLRVAVKMREDALGTSTLHIGYEHLFDYSVLVESLLQFKEQFPGVPCITRQHSPEELEIALDKKEIDCAFMIFPTDVISPNREIIILQKDSLSLSVHRDLLQECGDQNPLQVVKKYPLYGFLYNSFGTETVVEINKHLGIRPKLKICSSVDEIFAYVEAGLGCTILPSGLTAQSITAKDVEVIPLNRDIAEGVCLGLVYNKDVEHPELNHFRRIFRPIDPSCAQCREIFCSRWQRMDI